MSVYVVGDLQGCLQPLLQLLEQVEFNPAEDQLWLTGDLVNRGPQSLETLRFIKNMGSAAVTVLGNHDLHLLAIAHGDLPVKRKDTLDDILAAPDRDELLDWLRRQPLMVLDDTRHVALVHAGVFPGWTLMQAQQYAQEVEAVLRSDNCGEFFKDMYGNQPKSWSANLQGMDRLRFITNAFTRMRICAQTSKSSSDLALELKFKDSVSEIPSGFSPWFARTLLPAGWRIVFGHWAALLAHTGVDNVIALDSGCVWGRFLTMMRLEDGQFFYSPACVVTA